MYVCGLGICVQAGSLVSKTHPHKLVYESLYFRTSFGWAYLDQKISAILPNYQIRHFTENTENFFSFNGWSRVLH